MKKWISLLLAGTMLFSCINSMTVFAEETETQTVLFEENFEAQTIGEVPTTFKATENSEKRFLARTTDAGDTKALFIHHDAECTCGSSGGPRATSTAFDISTVKALNISLKVKSANNNSSSISFMSADTSKSIQVWKASPADWTQIEIAIDLEKMTFETKQNGASVETGALAEFGTPGKAQLRISSTVKSAGDGLYVDDVRILGIGAKEAAKPVNVEPTTVPTRTNVPTDAYVLTNTDLSDAPIGTAKAAKIQGKDGLEKLFTDASNYVNIEDVNGNRMVVLGSDDDKSHGPSIDLQLPDLARHFVLDYAVVPNTKSVSLNLYAGETQLAKSIGLINIRSKHAKQDDWNYVHLEIDLENSVIKQSINGNAGSDITFAPITDFGALRLNLHSTTSENMKVYLDNIALYATGEINLQGKLLGNEKIYWPNVKPQKPLSESSYVNNLKAHPRILINDWDEMRTKVNTDYITKRWYEIIKAEAQQAMLSPPTEYTLNTRGNIIGPARAARNRLSSLAFCYKIEGKQEYLDMAWQEVLAYERWADWSGFQSSLCTAELAAGYAYVYDWLYDDFSAEQKAKMVEILKKQALPDFIYNYENNSGFTATIGNWNPVCNTSNISIALAIADEEPEIAEYLLEVAPLNIWQSLVEWAPQGAYAEPVSYWNYGTNLMSMAQYLLNHAFVDSFEIPDTFKYETSPGVADTIDFQIHYTGPSGMFNYGDCTGDGYLPAPAAYWAATTFDKPQYAWWTNKLQENYKVKMTHPYYCIAAIAYYNPEKAYYTPGTFPLEKFYYSEDTVNGLAMRSSWEDSTALWAAMQGGNNGAGHAHLSLGTFAIDYMGERFINQQNYKDYALQWGNKQVAYWRRAESYNCLVINPSEEMDQNPEAIARLIRHDASTGTVYGIFDMTEVHDDYASAKRGIMMTDQRRRVIIQDEIVATKPSELYWYANTNASVAIAKDGKSALLTIDGNRMLARIIEAPAEAKFELVDRKTLAQTVYDIPAGNKYEGKKLRIHLKDKTSANISVEFVALKDGEGIPAPWQYTSMDTWTATDNTKTACDIAGSNVVLKLNTPNAIANAAKTFVDTNNTEVVPFTENGRTLVPVRFISEAFGAKVSWDDTTQTVGVKYLDKDIKLVIGSNQMLVNGSMVTLDVPANTYNGRTLIPLRALVEALGKKVFWDDRGLISIGDETASYTEEEIVKLISMLDIRVSVNGKDIAFFEPSRTEYTLDLNAGEATPQISVSTSGSETVSAAQASALGESAVVTINSVNYTFKMQPNNFEGILGHKDPGIIENISISMRAMTLPDHDTYIYVESLSDSTDWEKYPERGIVDGIINSEIPNRWASEGEGEWIQMDFGEVKNVHSMAFAGLQQEQRAYKFDVYASEDGINYTRIHEGGAPTTTDIMSIIPLGDVQARYIKFIGHGSSSSAWNTWCEVRFYESAAQQAEDISFWPSYFASASVEGTAGTSSKLFISATDADRSPVAVREDAVITYMVADESIATVAADGVVTFLKAGETTAEVTVTQDGFTAKCTATITVK